jgi:hypothetical protein
VESNYLPIGGRDYILEEAKVRDELFPLESCYKRGHSVAVNTSSIDQVYHRRTRHSNIIIIIGMRLTLLLFSYVLFYLSLVNLYFIYC